MDLKQLFTDDDAVSPVIGVILMVAITVILAAVIGAFVLNIGDSTEQVPQVSWDFQETNSSNDLEITHNGGPSISGDELSATGCSVSDPFDKSTYTAGVNETCFDGAGSTVDIVWTSTSSDQSQIIGTYEG
ncbi:type IV pilin [Haloarchaeobius sp. HRN-SO-5]|uniref:type IV pilin n=1 Tax=Haloarchaeobius sp. HRN-SO-5 TaxID=3446118 RepID=UPI003EB87BD9